MATNSRLAWTLSLTLSLGVFVPYALHLNHAEGRTLSSYETSQIFGGIDGRDCGFVSGCSTTGPPFCSSKGFDICTTSTEKAPVAGSGDRACNVIDPTKKNCTEGANNDCNITYVCAWNGSTQVCYRSTTPAGTVRAPSTCGFPPPNPPGGP